MVPDPTVKPAGSRRYRRHGRVRGSLNRISPSQPGQLLYDAPSTACKLAGTIEEFPIDVPSLLLGQVVVCMEIGETWAYRERAHTPGWPVLPVEILQFGPPRSKKVRVRYLTGEYPGLDQWVPQVRLRVPWDEAEAWLRDEQLYAAARAAAGPATAAERWAAWFATLAYPGPDEIHVDYPDEPAPTVEVSDPALFTSAVGLDIDVLLGEPGAFLDRSGTYAAPWPVALQIAHHLATAFPDDLLANVAEEERTLQHESIHGRHFDFGRTISGFVPPEACAEWLHERQPGFDLLRAWCDSAVVERFDEVQALRVEVKRLRELVEQAARRLEGFNHPRIARHLRQALEE